MAENTGALERDALTNGLAAGAPYLRKLAEDLPREAARIVRAIADDCDSARTALLAAPPVEREGGEADVGALYAAAELEDGAHFLTDRRREHSMDNLAVVAASMRNAASILRAQKREGSTVVEPGLDARIEAIVDELMPADGYLLPPALQEESRTRLRTIIGKHLRAPGSGGETQRIDVDAVLAAVDAEPELPLATKLDRQAMAEMVALLPTLSQEDAVEAFRILVRQTKDGIRDRIRALAPGSGYATSAPDA